MRKPAVRLQHVFEYVKVDPDKKFSIEGEGRHKSECKKLEKWVIAIKKTFVDALPAAQQAVLEWDFGTGNTCSLGTLPKTWEEYAEANGLEQSELPVILYINAPYFRKSDNPDLEWAIHFPFKICSPNLLLSRPSNKNPSDSALNEAAKALFDFSTTIAVKRPPTIKKRKAEGDATGAEEVEVEQAAGEEILAQVPLPRLSPRKPLCLD